MCGRESNSVPFAVVRNDGRTYVDQVVDGIRSAITDGHYKTGDLLPPMRSLAKACGVSMIVMNEAVSRLKDEGLVSPRRGFGCVVTGIGLRLWRGRVLFVLPDRPGGYYVNMFTSVVREKLARKGYLFSQTTLFADANGRYDCAPLKAELERKPDLVVQLYVRPQISRVIAKSGVPWIFIGRDVPQVRGATGLVRFDYTPAIEAFAARCAEAHIRRVLQVSIHPWHADARAALERRGIACEDLMIPFDLSRGTPEDAQRASLSAFLGILAKPRRTWPALVYFSDDNAARGAFAAMAAHGVRAPQDLKCVSWANSGNGPVYGVSLARMEMDPQAHGAAFADALLSCLSGKGFPDGFCLSPVWREGATISGCFRS